MIRLLINILISLKINIKGYLKINFIYPRQYPDCQLLSLLSPEIEAGLQSDVRIDRDVTFTVAPEYFGRHVYIGKETYIGNCCFIGDFSSISMDVKIGLNEHAMNHISTNPLFYAARRKWVSNDTFVEGGKPVHIGHDVLISANAVILNGITLGTGCVVGAGAIVTRDVPPYAIVAGVPAKIIRYRFNEELINKLLASCWWELGDHELKNLSGLYETPSQMLDAILDKSL